jgi:hypothetical protein
MSPTCVIKSHTITMTIYDEYVKVLRGMYRIRFNVGVSNQEISTVKSSRSPTRTPPPSLAPLRVSL